MKRKNREKRTSSGIREAAPGDRPNGGDAPTAPQVARWGLVAGLALVAAFTWAYWPTLTVLVRAWNREADYSHGFLVAPLAAYFLWARRRTFPGWSRGWAWPGVVLLLLSIAMRWASAHYYIDAVDGWSIVFWVAGVAWLAGGWRLLRWSWPSVVFLLFMVPMPWRCERLFSLPLQRIAARLSCWLLQCLGQPAIAEGNTIWVNDLQLEIEQACSGLRIFMAIIALAFVYLVLFARPWWQRALMVVSVVPIALATNAVRIAGTGIALQDISGESTRAWAHDVIGWLTLPLAAGLFALVLLYLDRLVREVEIVDQGMIVRQMME